MNHPPADDRPEFMALLGLLPPYSPEDIRKAYKSKARLLHPDSGGDAAEFNRLREAYELALEYAEFRRNRRGWLADQVERYTEHLDFVAELDALGCELTIAADDWRERSWGDFAQITAGTIAVTARGPAFDDSLPELLSTRGVLFESLRLVDLGGSRVTDAGLSSLASLPALLRVDVRRTAVTVEGVRRLCRPLRHLEEIHVGGTSINWLNRLSLRRQFREIEFITDELRFLDSTPRSRFTHLAEMALG